MFDSGKNQYRTWDLFKVKYLKFVVLEVFEDRGNFSFFSYFELTFPLLCHYEAEVE